MLPLDTLQLQHIFPVKCEGVWKERRVFLFQSQLAITKPCLDAVATNHLVVRTVLKVCSYNPYVEEVFGYYLCWVLYCCPFLVILSCKLSSDVS